MSRKLYINLLLWFGALAVALPAEARHIVGGEVTYACIGQPDANNRTYRIQVSLYRDATTGGAEFDSNSGNGPTFEMTIFRGNQVYRTISILGSGLDITDFEIVDPDACVVYPTTVRNERGVYTTELTLPIINDTYTVSYQRCCRTDEIDNLVNPGEAGATYLVEIPPVAQQTCNSSPVFNNFAPVVICANTQLNFDHSATDADGDQLVYSLCEPYYGGGNMTSSQGGANESFDGVTPNPESPPPYDPVVFRPPFSSTSPLLSSPTFSIDANTGLLRVNPTVLGVFVVCLSVQEYRNGQLIGEVRRDFQFNVVNCERVIEAKVTSEAAIDSLTLGYILFCGTKDIEVVNTSTDPRRVESIEWLLRGTTEGTVSSVKDTVTATYPDYGLYPVSLVANPGLNCSDTLDFLVRLTPPTTSEFDFTYDTCTYAPVEFENNSFTQADSIVHYSWAFGEGETSTEFEPLHSYISAGRRFIDLTVRDNFGCEKTSSKEIEYYPVPANLPAFVDGDRGCAPEVAAFRHGTALITEEYAVFWDFGNGATSTELNPDYQYTVPGEYNIYLSATSPIGCFVDTQFVQPLRIFESPISAFEIDSVISDVREPTFEFFDQSIEAVSWQWFFDSIGTSREENPIFSFPDTGRYKVDLVVSHLNGCLDTSTQFLRVVPYQSYFLPNAFTPNGDGSNEFFKGVGFVELISNFEMQIYNRWGEKIFETNDINEGWDGRNMRNGGDALPAVYLYLVTYDDPDGAQQLSGFVTLVR